MNVAQARFFISLFGMALALVAMLLKDRRVTWVAIAVLLVAFGLRFVNRNQAPPPES